MEFSSFYCKIEHQHNNVPHWKLFDLHKKNIKKQINPKFYIALFLILYRGLEWWMICGRVLWYIPHHTPLQSETESFQWGRWPPRSTSRRRSRGPRVKWCGLSATNYNVSIRYTKVWRYDVLRRFYNCTTNVLQMYYESSTTATKERRLYGTTPVLRYNTAIQLCYAALNR